MTYLRYLGDRCLDGVEWLFEDGKWGGILALAALAVWAFAWVAHS